MILFLSKSTSLSFPFQQAENITFSYGALDVTDNGTTSGTTTFGIHKFDTHLRHISRVARTSQNTVDFGEFDRLILIKQQQEEKMLVREVRGRKRPDKHKQTFQRSRQHLSLGMSSVFVRANNVTRDRSKQCKQEIAMTHHGECVFETTMDYVLWFRG